MDDTPTSFLAAVGEYFSAKLADHGETARGVDWNGPERQDLLFEQATKVILKPDSFSVNDLGCGYGALLDYLRARYDDVRYTGYDVCADMVAAGRARHADVPNARFLAASEPLEPADYGIASGIFNVRLDCADARWLAHIEATLDALDRTSRLGFAFNALTVYSDADRMRDYLYYADPCALFDRCKRRYSRNVALLHDYGLYEFTILVRKAP